MPAMAGVEAIAPTGAGFTVAPAECAMRSFSIGVIFAIAASGVPYRAISSSSTVARAGVPALNLCHKASFASVPACHMWQQGLQATR